MTRRLFTALITLGVALAASAPVCSHAQIILPTQNPAFVFSNDPSVRGVYAGPFTQMGVEFSVVNPTIPAPTTSVYSLGFYDSGSATGLATSHSVGIFSASGPSAGSLLVQATVAAGTAAPLVGNFRYATQLFDGSNNPINGPLVLTAGNYVLQAVSVAAPQSDPFIRLIGINQLSTATNVSYFHSEFGQYTSLTYPITAAKNQDGSFGYFGGNFLTTPLFAPVPEPGAWALMGSSLVAVGMTWRKRRVTSRRGAA